MLDEYMRRIGYSDKDIEKIRNDHALRRYTENRLYNKVSTVFDYLLSLGYTDKEIVKMTKKFPTIYSCSVDTLEQKIFDMIDLGYTDSNVKRIIRIFPNILGYSIDTLKQKIYDLMSLGYTKDQVINMTTIYPTMIGLKIEKIREKKKFYDQIGLGDVIVNEPSYLMQSLDLSYARYVFYHKMGIKINRFNISLLYLEQDAFVGRFGKTNEQLIKMYNYKEYLEKRKTLAKKK